eukprot:8935694-Pyramimonas_sp.AAC.1
MLRPAKAIITKLVVESRGRDISELSGIGSGGKRPPGSAGGLSGQPDEGLPRTTANATPRMTAAGTNF